MSRSMTLHPPMSCIFDSFIVGSRMSFSRIDSSRFSRIPIVGLELMALALDSRSIRAISNGRLCATLQLSMTAIASSLSCFVVVGELKTFPALSICPEVYFLAALDILLTHPLTSPCGFSDQRQTGSASWPMGPTIADITALLIDYECWPAPTGLHQNQNISGPHSGPFAFLSI